jgi:hypothetical protein
MLKEFLTVFYAWSGAVQCVFVLVIAMFLTAIVNKILDIFNSVFASLPILFHGWPKNSSPEVDDDDEDKKEIETQL